MFVEKLGMEIYTVQIMYSVTRVRGINYVRIAEQLLWFGVGGIFVYKKTSSGSTFMELGSVFN